MTTPPSRAYAYTFKPSAAKELASIKVGKIRRQLLETITRLAETLGEGRRPQDMKKLEGALGEDYRIDSGEYRIVFELDDKERRIRILRCGTALESIDGSRAEPREALFPTPTPLSPPAPGTPP